MYRLRFLLSIAATLFFSLALCSIAQAGPSLPNRTFVSITGDDANDCLNITPCRNFQRAHDAVADGGEVVALTSGGYGTLTITKNVTISGEGYEVESSAAAGDAITIATARDQRCAAFNKHRGIPLRRHRDQRQRGSKPHSSALCHQRVYGCGTQLRFQWWQALD